MALVVVRAVRLEISLRTEHLHRTAARFGVSVSAATIHYERPDRLELSIRELERVDDVRRVISRGPFDGTCLRQAFLVGRALQNRSPTIQIGVKKEADGLSAHAWLVVDGVVIDDYRARHGSANGLHVMPLRSSRSAP